MEEIIRYAEQWDASAKFMFDNFCYHWMASKIIEYNTVMELGCGTGYSTLELVQQGHHVIAIDKNCECLNASRKLISENGYIDKVIFLEGDITDRVFKNKLIHNYTSDIVICWNIGTYWSKLSEQDYIPHMLAYGLTLAQIKENVESSYAELIIWHTCDIAYAKGIPVHLIERCVDNINNGTRDYYDLLSEEFHYNSIKYDNFEGKSLSGGGRMLSVEGEVFRNEIVDVNYVSILMI